MLCCSIPGHPSHKLQVLLGLADNCELAPSGRDHMLEKAAEYRQKLFVEMIDQGLDVPRRCSVCHQPINAHRASGTGERRSSRVLVASCCHLFHMGCLQSMHEHEGCPICTQPLLLLIRTIK